MIYPRPALDRAEWMLDGRPSPAHQLIIGAHLLSSRGGAPALGSGGLSVAFRSGPTFSAPLTVFPVPRSSNRTCGFPASGLPTKSRLHVWYGPEFPTLNDSDRLSPVATPCLFSVPLSKSDPFRRPTHLGVFSTPNLSITLPARPAPHGVPVCACTLLCRASRVAPFSIFRTCRHHYPGGNGSVLLSLVFPNRRRPSLGTRRVLPHCRFRGLLDVHSRSDPCGR